MRASTAVSFAERGELVAADRACAVHGDHDRAQAVWLEKDAMSSAANIMGDYDFLEKIGVGGVGTVCKAPTDRPKRWWPSKSCRRKPPGKGCCCAGLEQEFPATRAGSSRRRSALLISTAVSTAAPGDGVCRR